MWVPSGFPQMELPKVYGPKGFDWGSGSSLDFSRRSRPQKELFGACAGVSKRQGLVAWSANEPSALAPRHVWRAPSDLSESAQLRAEVRLVQWRAAAVGLSALLVGVMGVTSGPVNADQLPFSVSVQASPTTINYPAQRSFVLTYAITTGGQPATVSLSEDTGSWRVSRVSGWPLAYGMATLNGPGTLRQGSTVADFAAGACVRGSDQPSGQLSVDVPASATVMVTQPVRIAAPPWPGMRVTPRVSVSPSGASAGIPLTVPAFTLAGKRGVHIRLFARRNGSGAVVISGDTNPVVRRGLFRVVARNVRTGRTVLVGPVRTGRRGRFVIGPWRLPGGGPFQFFASYNHPRRGLVGDRGCLPGLFP